MAAMAQTPRKDFIDRSLLEFRSSLQCVLHLVDDRLGSVFDLAGQLVDLALGLQLLVPGKGSLRLLDASLRLVRCSTTHRDLLVVAPVPGGRTPGSRLAGNTFAES